MSNQFKVSWDEAPAFLKLRFLPMMFAGTCRGEGEMRSRVLYFHWRQAFYPGVTPSAFKVWAF